MSVSLRFRPVAPRMVRPVRITASVEDFARLAEIRGAYRRLREAGEHAVMARRWLCGDVLAGVAEGAFKVAEWPR